MFFLSVSKDSFAQRAEDELNLFAVQQSRELIPYTHPKKPCPVRVVQSRIGFHHVHCNHASGRSGHFARLKTVVMRDTSAVNADETAAKPDELEPFADQVGAKGLLASDLPGWDCRQLGEDCRYVGRGCRLLGTSLKQSAGAVQGCWQTACL